MSISSNTAHDRQHAAQDMPVSLDGSAKRNPHKPVTLSDHLRSLHGYSVRFRHNETIFAEGELADHAYRIISGMVRLCRYTPSGRRHIADFAIPGDLIGLLECPDQPATAEAVTDVTLASYARISIDRLAASNPAVRTRVSCHLSANLLEAQHRLFLLVCQSAKERVASFLVRHAERTNVLPGEGLMLPMCRQDIADHLGLTTETVCRAMTALKNDGAVSLPSSHEVALTDMRVLRALAFEN